MLVAEIHGKIVPEAQNSEDYLTSTIFGHLRYIPPRIFWPSLFARAMPSEDGGPTLADLLWPEHNPVSAYRELSVRFWKSDEAFGEPDMILHFRGEGCPLIRLVVEAKLWSGKSGVGEMDQLARYLKILDRPPECSPGPVSEVYRYLVYLTPRNSIDEIYDSLRQVKEPSQGRRIFRLQWQDILDIASQEWHEAGEPTRTILKDVADFLERRGLEYFRGFRPVPPLPSFDGYRPAFSRGVGVFGKLTGVPSIAVRKSGWVNG